jgi:hypothetical protein
MKRQATPPSDPIGPWHVEPVHDSIVSARLDQLQEHLAAHDAGRPRQSRLRWLRVRVGRAIVALGSFVEGTTEPGDRPVMPARSA